MTQISQELEHTLTLLRKQELEFDRESHTYTVDGVVYPSVTQVLMDVGLIDTTWFRKGSDERGTRVHWICEQADKDTGGMRLFLDESLEEYEPYLDAWEDFKEKSGFVVSQIELPLYSKTLGIAGTLDRVGFLNDKLTILDIKSGVKQKWHGLQVAGYKMILRRALNQCGYPVELRSVYIKKTGKWTMENYTEDRYITDMNICINMNRIKSRY